MAGQYTDTRKLLLEAVAIVASILVAFAIDSAWDEYQEDKQRQYALGALRSDFERTHAGASSTAQFHKDEVARLQRLIELTSQPAQRVDQKEFVKLVQTAHSFSTFLPPTGAMDSLVGSGDLNVLLEPELRAMLARFEKILESMHRTQQWGLIFVNEQLTPFLSKKVPLAVFGFGRGDVRVGSGVTYSDAEVKTYAEELLDSLEFQNLVHTRLLAADLLAMKTELLAEHAAMVCEELGAKCLND